MFQLTLKGPNVFTNTWHDALIEDNELLRLCLWSNNKQPWILKKATFSSYHLVNIASLKQWGHSFTINKDGHYTTHHNLNLEHATSLSIMWLKSSANLKKIVTINTTPFMIFCPNIDMIFHGWPSQQN